MFNIGAVSRMTHIAEATLRVWERRYNFPSTTRTAGGHRVYSQQDIFRIQWVKLRIDEGMQVSHAIRALERAEKDRSFIPALGSTQGISRPIQEGTLLSVFHSRLLDALVRHNMDEATLTIGEAQVLYPLERIILEVIGPTLQDIGVAWQEGRMDVATEHLATNHLRQFLLMWMRLGPPAYGVNPILVACAPGELHEGSLLMLSVLLRRLRLPVLYIGQTMPLSDLSMFLEDLAPAVVVFGAMTEEPARTLAEWPHWLPEVARDQKPLITYGGRAFVECPELIELVAGEYLGNTLSEGVQKLYAFMQQLNPLLSS